MPEIKTNLPKGDDTLWFEWEDGTKDEYPCTGIIVVRHPDDPFTVGGFAVFYGIDPDPDVFTEIMDLENVGDLNLAPKKSIYTEGYHSCSLCADD